MAAGNDLFKLYRYDPSMTAAVIFIILFSAIQLYTRIIQFIGYIGRAVSSSQSPDWTVKPYIVQTLLLLVAPALYAASIYMILGRIILLTDGEQHSIVKRKWLTKLFVCGDVVSFFMQGAGGGIMASGTVEAMETGEHIIIGGLVVQIVVFSLFAAVAGIFHRRMWLAPTTKVLTGNIPWQSYLHTLYGASLLIMIRSLFRLIEYAQGNAGYLISHEVFLYIFDSVLMFGTMVLFAWYHPSEINAMLKRSGGKAIRRAISLYTLV
ncbi:RTA1 like protein-domain-containing protein [Ilyonectria sp. MPI-CAGE-AT-0026]|nr:RTA1 like protein-domain-containing protein [Ilyonectria sp. MPI-CAGE-AT-0026]